MSLLISTAAAQQSLPDGPRASYRIIVEFRTEFTPEDDLPGMAQVLRQRAQIQSQQKEMLGGLRQQRADVGEVRFFQTVPLAALTVDAAGLAALEADPAVAAIYEDALMRPQMDVVNTVIGSTVAWNQGSDGTGTVVAVLDTGIDFSHPAFAGKWSGEACFTSNDSFYGAVASCPNGQTTQYGIGASQPPVCSACTHGTAMAAISVGNAIDFKGVAPGARLIGVNVFSLFDDPGICGPGNVPCPLSYTSDQIRGLEYVYSLRHIYTIAAVNMSLGGGRHYAPCPVAAGAYTTIVNNLRSANIAVIAAAGNNGYDESLSSPACHPDIISVGATTNNNQVTWFSNIAYFLDLMAPGFGIRSATTAPDPGLYATGSGTSHATAVTSGAWAILRQAYPFNPVSENLSYLQSTGVPISIFSYNFRRINLSGVINQTPEVVISEQAMLAALRNHAQPGVRVILVVYELGQANIYMEINGFTGIVPVLVDIGSNLGAFRLGTITDVHGQPAPAGFIQTVNTQLPDMIIGALNDLLASRGEITLDYMRIYSRIWGIWLR